MFHNASDKNLSEDNDDSKSIELCDDFTYSEGSVSKWFEQMSDFANEFCRENDSRLNSFGTFSDNDIICKHSVKDASVATTNLGMFWFMVVCL